MLTPTVGPGVLVAPHTHRHEVTERVRPPCRFVVSVPATCEFDGTAPARRMMRAYPHRTFTTSPGALEKCLPGSVRDSHRNASLICKMDVNESTVPNDALKVLSIRLSVPRRNYTVYFPCSGVRCGRPGSNRHGLNVVERDLAHRNPNPVRLPFPPRPPHEGGSVTPPKGGTQGDRAVDLRRWNDEFLAGAATPVKVDVAPIVGNDGGGLFLPRTEAPVRCGPSDETRPHGDCVSARTVCLCLASDGQTPAPEVSL